MVKFQPVDKLALQIFQLQITTMDLFENDNDYKNSTRLEFGKQQIHSLHIDDYDWFNFHIDKERSINIRVIGGDYRVHILIWEKTGRELENDEIIYSSVFWSGVTGEKIDDVISLKAGDYYLMASIGYWVPNYTIMVDYANG